MVPKTRARDRRSGPNVAHNAARILAAGFVSDLVIVDKVVNPSTIQQDQSLIFGTEIIAMAASIVAQGRGRAKSKRKEK
jgi:hypothetical protein